MTMMSDGARCIALSLALLVAATAGATHGCGSCERPDVLAPRGVTPGLRLPWEEVSTPVTDWSFAAGENEIALETRAPWGRHSVTVWCVVVDRDLYIATDKSGVSKRWVRHLDRDSHARVGINKRVYPVRARRVLNRERWDAVLVAYREKYGAQFYNYDFPKPGEMSRGRIYRLESRR